MKINDTKLKSMSVGTRCEYPVSKLTAPKYNPRRISEDAMTGLRESIKRWGMVQEVVVNKRNGHVVGGNQRLKAAISEGLDTVPIFIVDLDDTEEKALNVALNNPHITGEYTEGLQVILEELKIELGDDFEDLRLDELHEEYISLPETLNLTSTDRDGQEWQSTMGAMRDTKYATIIIADTTIKIPFDAADRLIAYLQSQFTEGTSYSETLQRMIDEICSNR